jgi:AraC family transcriptional regulator of adaptative response/methylated-DNA-[protein]-cysteine methyltransferase
MKKDGWEDYQRVEKALEYLGKHFQSQPPLDQMARASGLSPFHFQRLFKRWAGISPKKFCQYLTVREAKATLERSRTVLDATFEAGLSSPGRLHDLFLTFEAMTPGEYKKAGKGLAIEFGVHPTPYGDALFALTQRGLCGLTFLGGTEMTAALRDLKARWPGARFRENFKKAREISQLVFGPNSPRKKRIRLLLKGSPFQLKVWEAALRVPSGKLVSYGTLARKIGKPKASRAVGSALGKNSIGYLVPCHRVIQGMGVLGPYRWGSARKKAMIGLEAALRESAGRLSG